MNCYYDLDDIKKKIERLRSRINNYDINELNKEEVLELSFELDQLILCYTKKKINIENDSRKP